MLILNSDHVKSVLTMKDCMEALEDAYRENALGRTVKSQKDPPPYDRFQTRSPLPFQDDARGN
jgi:ornithine cyclodeaminase/alanine dehydrogenase-like protein (mu-crystallin family)